jgi:lipoate---protein ligase
MPARRAQRKVPAGKLVRIDAVCDGHHFSEIRITGDFFVHPEESLGGIERDLAAAGLTGGEADLEATVARIVAENGARTVGFGPEDIATLLRELRC